MAGTLTVELDNLVEDFELTISRRCSLRIMVLHPLSSVDFVVVQLKHAPHVVDVDFGCLCDRAIPSWRLGSLFQFEHFQK